MSSKMRITSRKFTRNGEIALVLVKWAPRARLAEQGAHHRNLSRKIRLKMNSNRMRNILWHLKDLIKTRRVIGQCGWAWDWDALTCLALGGLSNDHGDGKESGKKANYARASGFFVYFFAVTAHQCQISRFVKDKTSDEEIFLPLFNWYGSYRNSTPGEPTVDTVS